MWMAATRDARTGNLWRRVPRQIGVIATARAGSAGVPYATEERIRFEAENFVVTD